MYDQNVKMIIYEVRLPTEVLLKSNKLLLYEKNAFKEEMSYVRTQ